MKQNLYLPANSERVLSHGHPSRTRGTSTLVVLHVPYGVALRFEPTMLSRLVLSKRSVTRRVSMRHPPSNTDSPVWTYDAVAVTHAEDGAPEGVHSAAQGLSCLQRGQLCLTWALHTGPLLNGLHRERVDFACAHSERGPQAAASNRVYITAWLSRPHTPEGRPSGL